MILFAIVLFGWCAEFFCFFFSLFFFKRGSRGGGDRGSGPPPPWDLSEVGSCVEAWWVHVGEGVQRLFSTYYYQIFSGSLRTPALYKCITYIHTSKFNIQYGTAILSLYFPYPNYERIQLPIPCFMKRHSCPELHNFTPFKTKVFWGRTPRPPLTHHIIKLPWCHLYRFQLYKRPCPTENKLVYR